MSRVTRVLLAVAASGAPAALVWLALAQPAQWVATERGLVLTESAATGQFQVVAVFTLIGVALGLAAGTLVHRLTRPARWQIVVALAAASSVAALLCWGLGVWLGPEPVQQASGLEVLDSVSAPLAVDAVVPFLVWPLAAVLAYTLSLYLSSDGVDREAELYADFADDQPPPNDLSARYSQ